MKRFFYQRIDSTNLEARRLLRQTGVTPPFWIIAGDQYLGRGQGGTHWESEANQNFTGSLVIRPERLAAARQFSLSQAISLALADFLELFVTDVSIKWPNDLYVHDKKIAGLLIDNDISGDLVSLSIIGVGVNINQDRFMSDAPNPQSLRRITSHFYDLSEIEKLIEDRMVQRLEQIKQNQQEEIHSAYLRKMYRYKEWCPFKSGEQWFEARIVGIGTFGELVLEGKSGARKEYGFKEVEFIL